MQVKIEPWDRVGAGDRSVLDRDPLGQGRLGPNPADCDGAMQVSMVRRTVMDLSGEDEDDRAELCSKLREVRRIHDVLVEKVAASEAELRLLASQALVVGADPGPRRRPIGHRTLPSPRRS